MIQSLQKWEAAKYVSDMRNGGVWTTVKGKRQDDCVRKSLEKGGACVCCNPPPPPPRGTR